MNNEDVTIDHPWLDLAFFDAQVNGNESAKGQVWQEQANSLQEREYGNLGTSTAANSNSTTVQTQSPLAALEAIVLKTEDENTSAASEVPHQEVLWRDSDRVAESCRASPSRAPIQAGKETRPSFSSSDGQLPTSRPEGQEPEQQEKNRARLRWTPELHSRFVQAISKLKSAENATPKGILNFMNVEGLTIFHIKSHLQKYRANMRASGGSEAIDSDVETTPKRKSSRSRRKKLNYAELCEGPSEEGEPECRLSQDWSGKGTGTGKDAEGRQVSPQERKRPKSAPSSVVHQLASPDADRQAKLKQALALQIEMQKRLHDQLETQRQLQASLEAHGKYISSLYEPETCSPCEIGEMEDALLDALPPLELAMSQGLEAQRFAPPPSEAWTRNAAADVSYTSATCLPLNVLLTDQVQTASQTLQSSPFQGDLSSFHMLQLDNEDQFKLPQSGTAGMSSNLRRARSKSLSDELNAMLASQFQHRHAQGGGAPAGQNLGSGWLGESISAVGENLIPTEAMPLNKSLAGLSLPFDLEIPSPSQLNWNIQAPVDRDALSQGQWSGCNSELPAESQLNRHITRPASKNVPSESLVGRQSRALHLAWENNVADLTAFPASNTRAHPPGKEAWNGQSTEMWASQKDGGQNKLAKGYWH